LKIPDFENFEKNREKIWKIKKNISNFFLEEIFTNGIQGLLIALLASILISTSDSLRLVKQIPDQIGTKNYRQVIKIYRFFLNFKLTRKLLVFCRKKVKWAHF
jgi:ABC-type antimicrobial peptide transport system permease subunit